MHHVQLTFMGVLNPAERLLQTLRSSLCLCVGIEQHENG
jgi:hypothetical protein